MADLSNIKVGDKVLQCYGGFSIHMRISSVVKVNKLHIVIDTGQKYRKLNGSQVNGYNEYIQPFDEKVWKEYLAEKNENTMRRVLRDFDWRGADKSLIEQVFALLPKKQDQ